MDSDQILAMYEEASRLTHKMLLAARANDWDRLVAYEKVCSVRFERLISEQPRQPQSAEFQRRKGALIRAMLDDDAQIRLVVEPWLKTLSMLIGNTRQRSRLNQAYGGMA
jgi:flagellar protein FliT